MSERRPYAAAHGPRHRPGAPTAPGLQPLPQGRWKRGRRKHGGHGGLGRDRIGMDRILPGAVGAQHERRDQSLGGPGAGGLGGEGRERVVHQLDVGVENHAGGGVHPSHARVGRAAVADVVELDDRARGREAPCRGRALVTRARVRPPPRRPPAGGARPSEQPLELGPRIVRHRDQRQARSGRAASAAAGSESRRVPPPLPSRGEPVALGHAVATAPAGAAQLVGISEQVDESAPGGMRVSRGEQPAAVRHDLERPARCRRHHRPA